MWGRLSFDNLNEALDHYYNEQGYYPDEVLADTLYRTRKNIALCSDLGICLSSPRLGREFKHVNSNSKRRHDDQKAENHRGEIEREFAFIKSKLGLDLATNRTAETITVSIDTAAVMANLERILSTFAGPISLSIALRGDTYAN